MHSKKYATIFTEFFFHTIVDLVAELPSSNVVTTFIKGGLVSTWRSLADITKGEDAAVEALFAEVLPLGRSIVSMGDDEIGAMATFE